MISSAVAVSPFPEHYNCGHLFAPFLVWYADDGNIFHLGMTSNAGLHLGGIDILPPCDDHVGFPVNEIQVAVLVPHAHVAGTEIFAFPGRSEFIGFLPVAGQHHRASGINLSDLVWFGNNVTIFVVQQDNVRADRFAAARAKLGKLFIGLEDR